MPKRPKTDFSTPRNVGSSLDSWQVGGRNQQGQACENPLYVSFPNSASADVMLGASHGPPWESYSKEIGKMLRTEAYLSQGASC